MKWVNFTREALKFPHMRNHQQALTEGALGEALAAGRSFFPHSPPPLLRPKAAINFSLHRPSPAAFTGLPQPCSAGNRCFKHTFNWQVLHTHVLENVRISRHRLAAHVGFFFFLGSQSPDFSCRSRILRSSLPSFPVVSIDVEQISHTTTFRLFRSDLGQSWDLNPRCAKQKTFAIHTIFFHNFRPQKNENEVELMDVERRGTFWQASQVKGRKSSWWQSERWQWWPR